MSLFEDAMSVAVQLSFSERERLARALGLKIEGATPKMMLPLASSARPDPVAWRKAETGHAVLATSSASDSPDGEIPPGPAALRGLLSHLDFGAELEAEGQNTVATLPPGSPALVHTSVVLALALDMEAVRAFWEQPKVEIRLATATYLRLLELCETATLRRRVRAFVQPFAVLSMGPMASSKAAELMLEGHAGLTALDALIAATALAHEIPLVTRDARPFSQIAGLQIATLA